MSSKILNGFTLTSETKQAQHIDKSAVRREKVVLNLSEQGDIARAMLSGNDYVSCRVVVEKDANGKLLPDSQRLKTWGKIIRKTSIDEIPQLINILKGEMSLIGPRPILPSSVEKLDDYQLRRQDVLPGISGWQTVNERETLTWEKTFEYDIYYIDNFSLWLDIKIFFKTIYMVFFLNRTDEDYRPTFDEYFKSK